MDRFDAMQAFARVVETGSFTQAANTLQVSRTTVTQLVQQLEARLRIRLLNRTTRKVNLTAEGARYYEQVVRLLDDLQAVEASLWNDAQRPAGRLRVDVPGPLARQVLLPALPAFLARYPGIELDMGVSDRHVDLIDESVDCVIRGGALSDLGARATAALAGGFSRCTPGQGAAGNAAPGRAKRDLARAGSAHARRRQCVPGGRFGGGWCDRAADLHGSRGRCPRGAGGLVRRLEHHADAPAHRLAPEPAPECTVTGVHRVGGAGDGRDPDEPVSYPVHTVGVRLAARRANLELQGRPQVHRPPIPR